MKIKFKRQVSSSLSTLRVSVIFLLSNLNQSKCFKLTSDVIGSDEPVKANVGEDVILPCHLEPPFNVSTLTVEWKRNKTYVHVYRSMKHDPNQQNSHFINRTYLFCDEIGKGNISLLLRNVSKEDEGLYICYVPKLHSQSTKNTDGADDTTVITAVITAVCTAVFPAVIIAFIAWYIWKCWQNRKSQFSSLLIFIKKNVLQ
uniref:Ig-like domain-containing protein n=1 Tax=Pundamilia nyererei TaxID=303518 RepID=A0A3B4G1P3_9CICH